MTYTPSIPAAPEIAARSEIPTTSEANAAGSAESGQTTAEYALVLLAAGTVAMLVVSWAQGNDAIGSLFDMVLSRITSLVG